MEIKSLRVLNPVCTCSLSLSLVVIMTTTATTRRRTTTTSQTKRSFARQGPVCGVWISREKGPSKVVDRYQREVFGHSQVEAGLEIVLENWIYE